MLFIVFSVSFLVAVMSPYSLLWDFVLHQLTLVVSQWSLRDSKSPQVSRTLLSILAGLSNAVVWVVSTCPLISKSSSFLSNPLGIIQNAPTTVGITFIFMFDRFFSSLARSKYLSLFYFAFFNFHTVFCQDR